MTLTVACRAGDSDKHELDVTYLLYHKGKLYSAGDDGKIKLWSEDLVKLAEVQAHPCSVFCLAANDESIFSCSNDGTIKVWELDTLKEKETLDKSDVEYWRIAFSEGCLFSGDNEGNVNVYKDSKLYGQVNVAQAVKDMAVSGHLVFTAKDSDLIITEIKSDGEKIQFGTEISIMGRAPVTLIGDNLFALVTRDGKDILVHENSIHDGFKEVAKVPHGSDLVINALAGVKWGDEEQFFSGGWDKLLQKWKISQNSAGNEGYVNVDIVINAIACGDTNIIYAGGSDGHIVRVDVR